MMSRSAADVIREFKQGHVSSKGNNPVDLELIKKLVKVQGFDVEDSWILEVLREEPRVNIKQDTLGLWADGEA